jgi:plastocyanin
MRLRYRRDRAGRTWLPAVIAGLVLVLAVAVVAAGCGSGTSGTTTTAAGGTATTAAGGAQVVIKGFAFSPDSITIKAGESVTWTNQDGATHTVTADNAEFKSSDLASGATFTFKFDKAGTYAYHCSIHSSMKGTVVVQ